MAQRGPTLPKKALPELRARPWAHTHRHTDKANNLNDNYGRRRLNSEPLYRLRRPIVLRAASGPRAPASRLQPTSLARDLIGANRAWHFDVFASPGASQAHHRRLAPWLQKWQVLCVCAIAAPGISASCTHPGRRGCRTTPHPIRVTD